MVTEKITKWRYINSGFNDARTNMAIDEAILDAYRAGNAPPTFRIYGWKPHGISLGFSQDPGQVLNIKNCERDGVQFVKRITGGEAIYHGDEITYSIACSQDDLGLMGNVKESFRAITSFIVDFYRQLGLEAAYFIDTPGYRKRDGRSTLCFAGSEDYDIMINGKKIGGNAQKRMKKIIFQHGSIPLSFAGTRINDYFAEDMNGAMSRAVCLNGLLGGIMPREELIRLLKCSFEKAFSVRLEETGLRSDEEKAVNAKTCAQAAMA